jgi:hypothetical protein
MGLSTSINPSAGKPVKAVRVRVVDGTSGVVYTIRRLLSTTSTLTLITGTDENLSLGDRDILAEEAISAGTTQVAVVREEESDRAVEYSVTVEAEVSADVPVIESIGLTGATGKVGNYLNAGDVVKVTVTFSMAVVVTEDPTVTLTVGSTAREAAYESGSGTKSLVFAYTIQAGDTDSDGIAIPANAASLNDGTIESASGVDASLTSSAIAANGTYRVDTAAPSAPTISAVAGNDVINASEATTTINGTSEANATINLTLGSGNVRTVTANGSGAWSYTLVSADITAMGQGAETISATATDAAGNTSSAATRNITIDTIAPTISSVTLSGAGASNDFHNVGDTVTATVVFDSVVTVSGTPQMALNIGGTTRQANYLSGSGSNTILLRYSIQSGDTDANGISIAANSLSLNSGAIIDSAGNPATLTHGALSDQSSWKVDTTAPTTPTVALGTGVSDGATHEEATAATGVITVSAETGSAIAAVFTRGANTVTKTATGTGSALAIVLTSGDLETLGDGTINVSVTATDAAGNVSTAATTSFTLLEPEPEPAGKLIVEPDEANSRFVIVNADAFPDGSFQWHTDDESLITGETTVYLSFDDLPAGEAAFARANGDPGTDSDKFIRPRDTTIAAFDAAAEANGALNGRHGFTAAASTKFLSNKLIDDGTAGGQAGFEYDLGTTRQRIDATMLFGNPAEHNESASTRREFRLIRTDNNNQLFVDFRGGFINAYKVVGGSYVWNLFPLIGDQNFDYDDYAIEAEPGVWPVVNLRIWRRGDRVDPGGPEGFNINSDGLNLVPGTKMMFAGPEGVGAANPAYPIPTMTKFKASEIVASSIVVLDADFFGPTISGPATLTFSGTSTVLNLEAMIATPDGKTVVPFTEFTLASTGATGNLVLNLPESIYAAVSGHILRVRDKANPGTYTDYVLGAVPDWRPIERDFMLGINTGSISSSYPLVFADMTHKIRWVYGTIDGYQLNPDDGKPTPPLGANGNPTGYIEDAAWFDPVQPARLIMPVLIEGDSTPEGTAALGGTIMPYGTAGAWEFKYFGTSGDFEFLGTGARESASPFSNFVAKTNGFTCDVTENGPVGPVTTWYKIKPTLAGGRGVANPAGINISMRKVLDATSDLLLPSVVAAYGREKLIRPMHEHMEGYKPLQATYPYAGTKWARMDNFLQLVKSYGEQATGWMCQPPLYVETSLGSDVVNPYQSVRRTFEKMAVDRATLYSSTSYTKPLLWEPSNEVFNWELPYVVYNKPFEVIADVMGFFSGMSAGGSKAYAQKHAGAAWLAKAAHEFFNYGTVPDLTALGFPSLADLANPAQALNGRVRTIFGIAGNSGGITSVTETKSYFDAIGGPGGIWAVSPSTYFYLNESDSTLLTALDANNQSAAVTRIHELLTADVANLIGHLKSASTSYRAVYPNLELIIYEGRWHNNPNFSTVTRCSRYLAASNAYRKTTNFKNLEKSIIIACIEAGYMGMADFVQYEGFADFSTTLTRRQNFGIMSDAGKFIDPATAADQMAQIGRLEIHDLIESWT